MTLQSSGAISLNQINTEFGRGRSLSLYRGTTWYTDAGSSGVFDTNNINFAEFYSKRLTSPSLSLTIQANYQELNLRNWVVSQGWNQSSAVTVTIAAGYYIWSNSTSVAALTIDGSWPGGITLINQGYIMGKGGVGGVTTSIPATAGGPAISLGLSITIDNTYSSGYIGGGGGGGAGNTSGGGGGAGGGDGGNAVGTPGQGGAIGQTGTAGTASSSLPITPPGGGSSGGGGGSVARDPGGVIRGRSSGGGGGRVFPGTGGTAGSGNGSFGGAGGSSNAVGADADPNVSYLGGAGGGGGWGASGGRAGRTVLTFGAAGGKAVQLNGYSVSWVSGDTTRVWGAVS